MLVLFRLLCIPPVCFVAFCLVLYICAHLSKRKIKMENLIKHEVTCGASFVQLLFYFLFSSFYKSKRELALACMQ